MSNTHKINLTVKVRLYPTREQANEFKAVTNTFRDICNLVSQWYFDKHFKVTRYIFQDEMYYDIRKQYPKLNSQMVQSIFRCVNARYKTVKTQLQQKTYHYKDVNTNKWYCVHKNLDWLQKPIHFKRPQADYVRTSNYSFVQNQQLISMNVLGKRIKVKYNIDYVNPLININAKFGTAKLINLKGKWYLHISTEVEYQTWNKDTNKHIVGMDRGLRQIVTSYDEQRKTQFFNGRKVAYQRRKYHYLRQQLQKAGTKSAKRHLKKLAQRENRYVSDINYCLTKTLVDYYGKNTLFVLEDLSNITFERKFKTKAQTRGLHSWSFYDFQQKLTYKALLNQSTVITVPAQYTSQRCPKCAQITKEARNHQLHQYHCPHCGFTTNDDRIGAMNLYELGEEYLNGNKYPRFIK